MVAAVAFESVVKLIAFLTVGIFITFEVYDGFADIFRQSAAVPALASLVTMQGAGGYGSWLALTLLSMAAIICLPRQFQVAVVENVDEAHIKKAIWLFPLYLFLINIFVLPIAFGGLLHFPDGTVNADTFVLTIPMAERHEGIALFAFIGGLSASTGMIIVATIALSTMVCNDLVMPLLLRVGRLHLSEREDLTGLLLSIRRTTIVLLLLLGYSYVRLIGDSYALVSIGLVSFTAAAQFAPTIIGGIFWKGASRSGALAGLTGGFIIWLYCLLLPSFARSGWLPSGFIEQGPFGIEMLRPYQLFGLTGMDGISHALVWSMLVNVALYVCVSLFTRQSIVERSQAVRFVDAFKVGVDGPRLWRGKATVSDLQYLVARFTGTRAAAAAFAGYAKGRGAGYGDDSAVDAAVVRFAERQLAGIIGAASARIMVSSVIQEEMPDIDQVMEILDEASQVIEYSRRLEHQSAQLQAAGEELRAANERLQELDKLKDDFVATVSHELRSPLTSIRSFSEILYDRPTIDKERRQQFLSVIISESERLTRLINDMLDLAKMEAGKLDWYMTDISPRAAIEQALAATSGLLQQDPPVRLTADLPDQLPKIHADADRLTQVVVNLISNAVKFCDDQEGWVGIEAKVVGHDLQVTVLDNGQGIARVDHEKIFDKFQQTGETERNKPHGTGLGLPISRQIIEYFGGRIWVESDLGQGTKVCFTLPLARRERPKASVPEPGKPVEVLS